MVEPIKLEIEKVKNEPYLVWNACIELLANSELDDLNDVQSVAELAWWYDSEVQNGGHLQYFENLYRRYEDRLSTYITMSLEALKIIGAKEQRKILSSASKLYLKQAREHPSTIEGYVETENEGEFEEYDDRYYDCDTDISEYLEKYIEKNVKEFIELV